MSEFRILDLNYIFESVAEVSASSEDPSFPASNLQNFLRSKVCRSTGYFAIDATNNKINLKDSGVGSELTATVATGSYTPTTLAAAIKAALEAASAHTYTVSFSSTTGLWTIATDHSFLSLLWSTGTNTATAIHATIGFAVTDLTGATTYTGASIALHTEEAVLFDLQTAGVNVDSFAMIFDPNLGYKFSGSAVLKLQANPTNVWSAPAVDVTLTHDDTWGVVTHFFSSSQDYRFWRLKVVDPANAYLYVEFPKCVLSDSTQLTQAPAAGFTVSRKDRSTKQQTPYGHTYSDVYPTLRQFKFGYANLSEADLSTLEQIFERVGTVNPVCVSLDSAASLFDKDRFFLYGYLKEDFSQEHVFYSYFNTGLVIEEAL